MRRGVRRSGEEHHIEELVARRSGRGQDAAHRHLSDLEPCDRAAAA